MAEGYKNLIPHIDIDRSTESVEVSEFKGFGDLKFFEFIRDIESDNDSIELHLIKSISYKEIIILGFKKADSSGTWREFLKEEQKTFGGSKIFYINEHCTKIMVLALHNEMPNKVRMVINRINKINEKLARINSRIKKENLDTYNYKAKNKNLKDAKDDIINLINQNLKV